MDTAAGSVGASNGCCKVWTGSSTCWNSGAGSRRPNSIDLEIVALTGRLCRAHRASILWARQTLWAPAPAILVRRSFVGTTFDCSGALALQRANSVGKAIDLLVLM